MVYPGVVQNKNKSYKGSLIKHVKRQHFFRQNLSRFLVSNSFGIYAKIYHVYYNLLANITVFTPQILF